MTPFVLVSRPHGPRTGDPKIVQKIEQQLHGHRVVVAPDDADPSHAGRAMVAIDEQTFVTRLDDELGWTCAALPFRGYASPLAVARALAASLSMSEQPG